MEIRRFGVGHRRPDSMPGAVGVSGQVLHADAHGVIAELAFGRNARIEPHSNPNATYFVVIEGGGFVQVGDERARVAAGEAVVWPPDQLHGASTEQSEMRALVVEFALAPPHVALLVEGAAVELESAAADSARRSPPIAAEHPAGRQTSLGEGSLAPRPSSPPDEHVSPDGEPW